jgi:hypothetical protein
MEMLPQWSNCVFLRTEIKMSLQRRQIKEKNDESENRAAFMRIHVA